MDKGFLYFIIGCIVIAPIIFLVIRLNIYLHKKGFRNFQEPRNLESMRDPLSFPNTEDYYRRNPPSG